MLNKYFIGALCVALALFFFSCAETTYEGEDIKNYPDLNQLFNDSWDMKAPLVYWKVSKIGKKIDSTQIQSTSMPWDEIKTVFEKAAINREELNHHYTIDIIKDSTLSTITLYYKTLAPEDYTRTLNIISDELTSDLTSIYFETLGDDNKLSKVLYLPNKLLQIQEKGGGVKDQISVNTYYFPE